MLFRKVIMGNVYRLPRETSTDNKTFIDEFPPHISSIETIPLRSHYSWRFHIYLLDIKTKDKVLTFFIIILLLLGF